MIPMLTSKTHGYLDYFTVVFFALAPSLFPLSETGTLLAYALAVIHLLMTVFTGFSMSLIKLIPFKVHGYVELVASLFLIVVPWLLADFFSDPDRILFTLCGLAIGGVWFATSYKNPLEA